MLAWILLTVVALAAVLYAERAQRPRIVWVAKPLASIGFIGAAVANGAFDTAYGNAVFLALVWSFLGDVFLIPRDSRPAFTFGIVSFLVGHLGFIVAFRVLGLDLGWAAAAAAGLLVPAVVVWRWLAPHLPRGMVIPVALYVVVITGMLAAAIGTWPRVEAPIVLAAAILFYLSDLTVARQRFVVKAFANRMIGLPLYYAGQLLFAASVTPAVL